jgi:hypothetical protein
MVLKSHAFSLYDHPSQMEPLLPGERRLAPLLEQAHDLIRRADQLSGLCQPGALGGFKLEARHRQYETA